SVYLVRLSPRFPVPLVSVPPLLDSAIPAASALSLHDALPICGGLTAAERRLARTRFSEGRFQQVRRRGRGAGATHARQTLAPDDGAGMPGVPCATPLRANPGGGAESLGRALTPTPRAEYPVKHFLLSRH